MFSKSKLIFVLVVAAVIGLRWSKIYRCDRNHGRRYALNFAKVATTDYRQSVQIDKPVEAISFRFYYIAHMWSPWKKSKLMLAAIATRFTTRFISLMFLLQTSNLFRRSKKTVRSIMFSRSHYKIICHRFFFFAWYRMWWLRLKWHMKRNILLKLSIFIHVAMCLM